MKFRSTLFTSVMLAFVMLAFVMLALSGSSFAQPLKKLWSFKPDKGFIDDPSAFSADGARFAFIHTDSALFLKIILINTKDFAKAKEINIVQTSRQPRGLFFTDDGKKLVYLSSDEDKGRWQAELIDILSGKPTKKLGPATSIEQFKVKGDQAISLINSQTDAKGQTAIQINAYRVKDLRRLGGGSFTIAADGEIRGRDTRLFYWEPGHLSFVGMKKGSYDKQRDVRLPQQAIRYDLLTRREIWNSVPKDLMGFMKIMNMRANHQAQMRFVEVSEDLKDLLLVNTQNEQSKLNTPVKWQLYEPKSLRQWESPDGQTLFCSLTIDPVNQEALKVKKAHPERMDLYRIGGSETAPQLIPLGQVLTDQRGFTWLIGDKHFSYLRKLKGFARGGKEIEIYPLPAGK